MAPRAAKRESKKTEYGISGLARFVKLDENRARIDFENGKSVNFQVKQGNVWEDETATLPEFVPFKAMKENGVLNVKISMEKGDTRILYIHPTSGELKVKFDGFKSKGDEPPVWEVKPGKKDGTTYRQANPFMTVVDGRWKGCRLMGYLSDYFGEWKEDGNTTVYGEGTNSQKCRDFSDCVGFDYGNTPYSENLLPLIEKVAKENDNTFTVVLNGGWVTTYVPSMQEDAFVTESDTVSNDTNELLKD